MHASPHNFFHMDISRFSKERLEELLSLGVLPTIITIWGENMMDASVYRDHISFNIATKCTLSKDTTQLTCKPDAIGSKKYTFPAFKGVDVLKGVHELTTYNAKCRVWDPTTSGHMEINAFRGSEIWMYAEQHLAKAEIVAWHNSYVHMAPRYQPATWMENGASYRSQEASLRSPKLTLSGKAQAILGNDGIAFSRPMRCKYSHAKGHTCSPSASGYKEWEIDGRSIDFVEALDGMQCKIITSSLPMNMTLGARGGEVELARKYFFPMLEVGAADGGVVKLGGSFANRIDAQIPEGRVEDFCVLHSANIIRLGGGEVKGKGLEGWCYYGGTYSSKEDSGILTVTKEELCQ